MGPWKPALKPDIDLRTLPLTPDEGLVAARIDGTLSTHELALLTGLGEDLIAVMVERLAALDVLLEGPPEELTEEAPEVTEANARLHGTHRKLFETTLHPLAVEERIARARVATEPDLSAFCFDPVPIVIQAVLANTSVGLIHARLVAAHHHNAAGLEQLTSRPAFGGDVGVRRALLKNPQLSPALYRRLFSAQRLLAHFQRVTSREVTEQTRRTAREVFRARFIAVTPEERVELIFKTEGRCLPTLVGLPLDGKTTSLLCSRSYHSNLLVQNLARFGPTPPTLLAHLLRQELVRRSPMLRALVARHPNAPADPRAR